MKTKKIPKFYIVLKVHSCKDGKLKYTHVRIASYNDLPFDIKQNKCEKTSYNTGMKEWSISFYVKSNENIESQAKMVKKALYYAKKKGVKIFKNIAIG